MLEITWVLCDQLHTGYLRFSFLLEFWHLFLGGRKFVLIGGAIVNSSAPDLFIWQIFMEPHVFQVPGSEPEEGPYSGSLRSC